MSSAAIRGHLEIVKLLLKNGADIHITDDEALRRAAINGHYDIVDFLLYKGANPYAFSKEEWKHVESKEIRELIEGYKVKQTHEF